MKTVGIIGGLSPESSMIYYQGINDGVRKKLGGHHNAKILLNSLDFGEFVTLKEKGDWDTQSELLCNAARSLEKAGADFIVLATNTMHKMAGDIKNYISIPFLHLADATAQEIKNQNIDKVALLGTRYTMEQDFYKSRIEDHGIEVIVPDKAGMETVNNIIYDELCNGIVNDTSRDKYVEIIADLEKRGAEGAILGCTEITMLISQSDINIAVFDTTAIHIDKALELIFST